jgi:hypothetical protein
MARRTKPRTADTHPTQTAGDGRTRRSGHTSNNPTPRQSVVHRARPDMGSGRRTPNVSRLAPATLSTPDQLLTPTTAAPLGIPDRRILLLVLCVSSLTYSFTGNARLPQQTSSTGGKAEPAGGSDSLIRHPSPRTPLQLPTHRPVTVHDDRGAGCRKAQAHRCVS